MSRFHEMPDEIMGRMADFLLSPDSIVLALLKWAALASIVISAALLFIGFLAMLLITAHYLFEWLTGSNEAEVYKIPTEDGQ